MAARGGVLVGPAQYTGTVTYGVVEETAADMERVAGRTIPLTASDGAPFAGGNVLGTPADARMVALAPLNVPPVTLE